MRWNCAVRGCANQSTMKENSNIVYHKFPNEKDRLDLWIKFCSNEEGWSPLASQGICSAHFQSESYDANVQNRKKLCSDATPVLHPACRPTTLHLRVLQPLNDSTSAKLNAATILVPPPAIRRNITNRLMLQHMNDRPLTMGPFSVLPESNGKPKLILKPKISTLYGSALQPANVQSKIGSSPVLPPLVRSLVPELTVQEIPTKQKKFCPNSEIDTVPIPNPNTRSKSDIDAVEVLPHVTLQKAPSKTQEIRLKSEIDTAPVLHPASVRKPANMQATVELTPVPPVQRRSFGAELTLHADPASNSKTRPTAPVLHRASVRKPAIMQSAVELIPVPPALTPNSKTRPTAPVLHRASVHKPANMQPAVELTPVPPVQRRSFGAELTLHADPASNSKTGPTAPVLHRASVRTPANMQSTVELTPVPPVQSRALGAELTLHAAPASNSKTLPTAQVLHRASVHKPANMQSTVELTPVPPALTPNSRTRPTAPVLHRESVHKPANMQSTVELTPVPPALTPNSKTRPTAPVLHRTSVRKPANMQSTVELTPVPPVQSRSLGADLTLHAAPASNPKTHPKSEIDAVQVLPFVTLQKLPTKKQETRVVFHARKPTNMQSAVELTPVTLQKLTMKKQETRPKSEIDTMLHRAIVRKTANMQSTVELTPVLPELTVHTVPTGNPTNPTKPEIDSAPLFHCASVRKPANMQSTVELTSNREIRMKAEIDTVEVLQRVTLETESTFKKNQVQPVELIPVGLAKNKMSEIKSTHTAERGVIPNLQPPHPGKQSTIYYVPVQPPSNQTTRTQYTVCHTSNSDLGRSTFEEEMNCEDVDLGNDSAIGMECDYYLHNEASIYGHRLELSPIAVVPIHQDGTDVDVAGDSQLANGKSDSIPVLSCAASRRKSPERAMQQPGIMAELPTNMHSSLKQNPVKVCTLHHTSNRDPKRSRFEDPIEIECEATQFGNDSAIGMESHDNLHNEGSIYGYRQVSPRAVVPIDQDGPSYDATYVSELKKQIQNTLSENSKLIEQMDQKNQYISILKESNGRLLEQHEKDLKKLRTYIYRLEKKIRICKAEHVPKDQMISVTKKLLRGVLTENELDVMIGRKTKPRWTAEEISKAFTIRYLSKRAYVFLRKDVGYPLPGLSTLSSYAGRINLKNGLLHDVLKSMKMASGDMAPQDRACVLSFDEMSVRKCLEYDVPADEIVGPHSHVQVVMARGLFSSWKQIVYVAFDQRMEKPILFSIIVGLFEAGYNVVAINSDNGAENVGLRNQLNITLDRTSFPHPVSEEPVFVFGDAPHNLKLIRNWLVGNGLDLDGQILTSKLIRQLVEERSYFELTPLFDLNLSHLELSSTEKQNVGKAAKLLSHTTATAIKQRFSSTEHQLEADTLSCFISVVNQWFDIFNSYSHRAAIQGKRSYRGTAEQIKILDNMHRLMLDCRGLTKTGKKWNFLAPFQKSIIMSITSLKGLFRAMVEKYGIQYISTFKLNQDIVENLFSQIRTNGGLNDRPTPMDVIYRLRLIILGKTPSITQKNTNTVDQGNDNEEYLTSTVLKKAEVEPIVPQNYNAQAEGSFQAGENDHADAKPPRNTSDVLVTEHEFDGFVYLLGWVAYKLKQTHPHLGSPTSQCNPHELPVYLSNLSYGGLMAPSTDFIDMGYKMENTFVNVHGLAEFKNKKKVVELTTNEIMRLYPHFDVIVVKRYLKIRTIIRVRHINLYMEGKLKANLDVYKGTRYECHVAIGDVAGELKHSKKCRKLRSQ